MVAMRTRGVMQDLIEEKVRDLILNDTVGAWTATTDLLANFVIEPAVATGRRFVVKTAGETGATQPVFPSVRSAATITDGSVAWEDAGVSPSVLKVVYRGEPEVVPVRLYPFAIVFLRRQRVARGEDGYGDETGYRYWRYEGYVSAEVLFKDTAGLLPDANRRADVPSYLDSKELTQAVVQALTSWDPDFQPVLRPDLKESTVGNVWVDDISNGLESRPDNVSNRGNAAFHLYTREQTW